MRKNRLQLEQLEQRIQRLAPAREIPNPPIGLIKAIRSALGMSMQQLATKLGVTKQGIHEMEKREQEGAITLRSLKEVANAMDMDLVYGFVPREGSMQAYIDKRAHDLAKKIVSRASQTMALEDQSVSEQRLQQAIEERAETFKRELPKALWDLN